MQLATPMFESMRRFSGRKSGGLRRALEEKRETLAGQGMAQMNGLLGQWIDLKLFAPEQAGLFSRERCFTFATTVQAFLWQTLRGQASCRETVQQVQAARLAVDATIPDTGTA